MDKDKSDYLSAVVTPAKDDQPATNIFKPKNLTKKQAHFVKLLIDNPKMSATRAVIEAYGSPDKPVAYGSAQQIAFDNLRKPNIVMALGEHSELFESAIVGTVRDWKNSDSARKREIALDAAKFGHDKIHGKATTKIEQQTSVVQIAINLAGDNEAPPKELLDL